MKSYFSNDEIKSLYFKINEIQRISSLKPNLKYLSDNSLDYSLLEVIESLSLISLLLICGNSNMHTDNSPSTVEYTKEYIINKVNDSYNYMKIYEIEFII